MGRFARALSLLAAGSVVLALVGSVLPLWSPGVHASPASQDAVRGLDLYMRTGCYECHGTVGQGAQGVGPRLAPNPIAFDRFARALRDPIDVMPRYPPQFVSDQDVADLYAYLQTIPPPPAPEEIPLLNP